MDSLSVSLAVAAPWVIEALWAWLWLPGFLRAARERRELQVRVGRDIPVMFRTEEMYSLLGSALYHLPIMLVVVLVMPRRVLDRWPSLGLGLTMTLTPVLYSGIVVWVAGLVLRPDS